jgi:hypothetical protein
MQLNCHKFTIIYSQNTTLLHVSARTGPSSVSTSVVAQNNYLVMFGLTVRVEELLAIFYAVNCCSVD